MNSRRNPRRPGIGERFWLGLTVIAAFSIAAFTAVVTSLH